MRSLPTEGFSRGISEVIGVSWRAGTQTSYSTPIQRWLDFCSRWEYHPQYPTVNQVLDFLHYLHEMGMGYSATETHRSTLSVSTSPTSTYDRKTYVSNPVYERCFQFDTSSVKVHQNLGCKQNFCYTFAVLDQTKILRSNKY